MSDPADATDTTEDKPNGIPVVAQFANAAQIGFTPNEFLIHLGVSHGKDNPPIHAGTFGITPQFAQQLSRALADAVAKYRVAHGSIVEGGLIVPARGALP